MLPLHVFLLALAAINRQTAAATSSKTDFVKTRNLHFVLNGNPFFANGFNAYWLMLMASDPSQRCKVSAVFQQAASCGLNVGRTWAFSDGGSTSLQYAPGSYNENMFKGLDYVLNEASKYGIKLILSLVNNYDNFGGKKQYVEWARHEQYLNDTDDFFRNEIVKGFYKNHVKAVLTRKNSFTGTAYKDDPTIFAWELMNEPRLTSDSAGTTLQAWIREMAVFLKSIDGNHLLEVGLEGFYGGSSPKKQFMPEFSVGTDFISNNQVPEIDFATVHSYPDQWMRDASDRDQLRFLSNWMDAHIQDAGTILRKPLLFTEFGKSSKDSGYNIAERESLFRIVYRKIVTSAASGGAAAGGLFWQLLDDRMESFRDGYEIIFKESPSTTSLITQQSLMLRRLQKMYARLRDIEELKRATAIRKAHPFAGSRRNKSGH